MGKVTEAEKQKCMETKGGREDERGGEGVIYNFPTC